MRVPAAQLLQYVAPEIERRAAKRNGQPEPRHARQHGAEPGRVLNCETAREPVLRRVVVVENALQAGDLARNLLKTAGDLGNLIGVGRILGVENADDITLAEIERVIQRARLGARL